MFILDTVMCRVAQAIMTRNVGLNTERKTGCETVSGVGMVQISE